MFFHHVVQCRARHAKALRGLADNATGLAKDPQDMFTLNIFHRRTAGEVAVGITEFLDRSIERVSLGKDDGSLDEILELPNIAGPRPFHQTRLQHFAARSGRNSLILHAGLVSIARM